MALESPLKRVVCKRKPATPGLHPPELYTRAPSTKGLYLSYTQNCTREPYKAKKSPLAHCETGSVQTPFSEPVSAFAASNSLNAPSFTCLTLIFNPLPPFPWCLCICAVSNSPNGPSFTQSVSTFVAFNPFSTCLSTSLQSEAFLFLLPPLSPACNIKQQKSHHQIRY